MPEKFDVIVVGAGPAGNAAAYVAAKGGRKVLQIERGETPGSKNVQGAILYADALEKIIPDFRDEAPLERHIVEQRAWVLDDASHVAMHYRSEDFNRPPYNRYTIIRAQFDQWFSEKVVAAGALVINETTVTELIVDGDTVLGVRTDRVGGEVYADCVILADGVNSLLARKAGFRPELKPDEVALAVKEIHFLPQEVIESRFSIPSSASSSGGDDQYPGVAIEMAGKITRGMMGTAFLYTNRESITFGIGCMLSDFMKSGVTPYQLLDDMRRHPSIAPLLAGGEMKEYAAHLLPEGGYDAMPALAGNGWMICGDAGGMLNSVHREGSNLAMTSGMFAAETLLELAAAGKPPTKKNLALYRRKLEDSFVMKDLKKYRRLPPVFHRNPQFFSTYPELLNRAAHELIKVDGVDKKSKEKRIGREFRSKRGLLGMAADAFRFWRAFQ